MDRLFDDLEPGERLNIAYMGGEPLLNRALVREVTEYASGTARQRGTDVGFSLTTNGTLLTADDGEFFERHGFAVTVSLDGVGDVHDRLRPFKGGRGPSPRCGRRSGRCSTGSTGCRCRRASR